MRIGLISDTHGLLRPEALAALEGADMILHAGDVGGADVISGLEALAPTRAVRGNNDRDPFGLTLPHELSLELEGVGLYMVHDRADIRGGAAGCGVAITGHSHRPGIEEVDGVLAELNARKGRAVAALRREHVGACVGRRNRRSRLIVFGASLARSANAPGYVYTGRGATAV